MIEVEKKFKLNPDKEKELLAGAQFLGEKTFVDIYYDTADYKLTKSDTWLRKRDGKFQLKVAMFKRGSAGDMDQYNELENDKDIREHLNITKEGKLEDALRDSGYGIFCQCKTVRRKYKKGEFIIDLDSATFPDLDGVYQIGEIELLVNSKKDMPKAIEKISQFAKSNNLDLTLVRGKVLYYLNTKRPKHIQALKEAWGVRDL